MTKAEIVHFLATSIAHELDHKAALICAASDPVGMVGLLYPTAGTGDALDRVPAVYVRVAINEVNRRNLRRKSVDLN
jgi:hypothetical protein